VTTVPRVTASVVELIRSDFTLCGGFKSISPFDGRAASFNHGFVARVADITSQGSAVIADISYTRRLDSRGRRARSNDVCFPG